MRAREVSCSDILNDSDNVPSSLSADEVEMADENKRVI